MGEDEHRPGRRERVWERPASSRNGPIAGFLISALALFGAIIVGLAVAEGSLTEAGARVDGWIANARAMIG